jgi:hypothetical protein
MLRYGAALQRAPTLDVHKYHKGMIITVGFAWRKETYNGMAISYNRFVRKAAQDARLELESAKLGRTVVACSDFSRRL